MDFKDPKNLPTQSVFITKEKEGFTVTSNFYGTYLELVTMLMASAVQVINDTVTEDYIKISILEAFAKTLLGEDVVNIQIINKKSTLDTSKN